jgi:hypothetical protein
MSAKKAKKMRKMLDLKNSEKEDLRVISNKPLINGKLDPRSSYTMINTDPVKRKYKEVKKILKNKELYDHVMKQSMENRDE